MKKILRTFLIETIGLYIIAGAFTGLEFQNGISTLLLAGASLTLASIVVRPVINILLLPINLLTFNLFKWASSAIALYIVTLVVPGFIVKGFGFWGYQSVWVDIPAFNLTGVLAFVAISFLLSFFSAIIHWVIK